MTGLELLAGTALGNITMLAQGDDASRCTCAGDLSALQPSWSPLLWSCWPALRARSLTVRAQPSDPFGGDPASLRLCTLAPLLRLVD